MPRNFRHVVYIIDSNLTSVIVLGNRGESVESAFKRQIENTDK